jgi:hypothetical protein
MIPGGIANEYLSFEKVSQLGGGLDLSLLGNRLRFSTDIYQSNTDDMLIFEKLSSYHGYEIYPSNRASLEKKGFDLSLMTDIVHTNNFRFSLGANLSKFNSVITSIPEGELETELDGGFTVINRVGEQANSFYGYQFEGVYATTQEAMDAGLVNAKGVPFGAGDAKFADLAGWDAVNQELTGPDGIINEFDKVILGSALPEWYGGIFTDFQYKRWGLNIFWQFVSGNEVYNYVRYENEKMTDISNQSKAVLNRWVSEGQQTNVPRSLWGDPMGNSAFSSRWIEDGSYIRLKSITLSYLIPTKVGWFRDLHVFLTGSNLLTLSNYLSFDPEFASSFNPAYQGVDYGLMPIGPTIMAGVKFGL